MKYVSLLIQVAQHHLFRKKSFSGDLILDAMLWLEVPILSVLRTVNLDLHCLNWLPVHCTHPY